MREKLLKEILYSTSRSSGPGGQHVNKTESRVTLQWHPGSSNAFPLEIKVQVIRKLGSKLTNKGELIMSSQRYRSQVRNKEDVTERFLNFIERISRPPTKRVRTKPSGASRERRLKEKKERSESKQRRANPHN